MTYHLTTGDHNETAETLGEFCGETFADLDDAQSAADHINEHLAGVGADFRAAVVWGRFRAWPGLASPFPVCQGCADGIGGAAGGPDAPWRLAEPGETCQAEDCESAALMAIIIEHANTLANVAGLSDEMHERVLGAGVPTPDECLAVAQLALAGLLTLPGVDDRCAMCGVIDAALDACEGETAELIGSMLELAEAMTAHCEDR